MFYRHLEKVKYLEDTAGMDLISASKFLPQVSKFFVCFGGHANLYSGIITGSVLRDHYWHLRGSYGVSGIKSGSVVCEASTLPTV